MSNNTSQNLQNLPFPPQQQEPPGIEAQMSVQPQAEDHQYVGSHKLKDKVALITGGDSGIGRAVAIIYAKEGADVAIIYLNEHEEKIERFGTNVPMLRPGQPHEIAPSYLFLASEDSSYMSGQILHPNGGEVVDG